MPKLVPMDIDSKDDFPTKPKRESGADDKVPQSRDISKMVERQQRKERNPST